ncbi:MAG: chorismate-binding protein, partial [Bacteroidia bacterium]
QNAEYIEISKTEELNTGNLTHLVNKINFKTTHPVAIINNLHPTPAVCGVPYLSASYFIDKSENLDREYYSGFLGPIFKNHDFSFWVNLRCAKITGDEIKFYAGAGIVEESQAEAEWFETERKMDTLRSML